MTLAYVGVGSNLGEPHVQVRRALRGLGGLGRVRCAPLYRTEPLGPPDQPAYLNTVVELETGLPPARLLHALKRLERRAGRPSARVHWGPRSLDLDLLLYGDLCLDTGDLVVPHPRMAERRFVLEPLAALAPGVFDPRSGRTAAEMLAGLDDPLGVEKLPTHGGAPMKIFLDTAHVPHIREATELGLCDGVTTNPSLLAKEDGDPKEIIREIAKIVEGPISAEVVSLDAEGMVREGLEWVKIASNIVVKIPMCEEGLKAIRILSSQDVQTNTTLIFNPLQALLAAKAGATMVSPFVGRLDDIQSNGMELIEQIVQIFGNYGISTQVLVASIRGPMHAVQSALAGADIATIPWADVQKLVKHPLTESGIERFLADWEKVKERG